MILPIALLIFGLGGPIKSVKCVQHPAVGGNIATQVCTVTLRKAGAEGDRITLFHTIKSHIDPATREIIIDSKDSAESMWELGRNGYSAGVTSIDLYESPETEVVGVRYDGRGSVKAVK